MEEKKSIKLTIGNPAKKVPPVLGTPVHVDKGAYVIKNRAIIGKVYLIICPKCKKTILVKASSAKTHKVVCKECGTLLYYMGKEVAALKKEETLKTEQNESSSQEPTQQESNPTIPVVTPNGRLEWGSIFKKKSWKISYAGSFFIGRLDDEVQSDVSIDDEFASRRSLLLEVLPERGRRECKYKITVNNATNPVLINGRAIELGESTYLNYGDTILVGNTTLTFKKDH